MFDLHDKTNSDERGELRSHFAAYQSAVAEFETLSRTVLDILAADRVPDEALLMQEEAARQAVVSARQLMLMALEDQQIALGSLGRADAAAGMESAAEQ